MKYHLIRVLILLLSIPVMVSAQFEEGTEVFKKTIYTSTVEAGNYTTLLSALEATEMVGFLDGDAPFTIFAPSDLAMVMVSVILLLVLLKLIPMALTLDRVM